MRVMQSHRDAADARCASAGGVRQLADRDRDEHRMCVDAEDDLDRAPGAIRVIQACGSVNGAIVTGYGRLRQPCGGRRPRISAHTHRKFAFIIGTNTRHAEPMSLARPARFVGAFAP